MPLLHLAAESILLSGCYVMLSCVWSYANGLWTRYLSNLHIGCSWR